MRQRLAAAGAMAVKNSVYLLPHGDDAREDLEWIAQEIVAGGGDAHLFEGDFVDRAATAAAIAQFQQARATDYRDLAAEAQAAARAARKVPGSPGLVQAHERLSKRFQQVRRLDFFDAAGRADAERALAAMAAAIARGRKGRNQCRQPARSSRAGHGSLARV